MVITGSVIFCTILIVIGFFVVIEIFAMIFVIICCPSTNNESQVFENFHHGDTSDVTTPPSSPELIESSEV